jgi:HD-GYP domain-containing protein (c-di-GMP phosphodiesterase class II)
MFPLNLEYPVYSLDKHLYLPPGTTLTENDLHALIASSKPEFKQRHSLTNFGTVKNDIISFLTQTPGSTLFSDEKTLIEVIELIGHVHLSLPELNSVDYFKEHDPYTYRHILTVLAYSTLLSRELVANYQAMIREMTTSPLHDFGKVCIPLEILKKSSALTHEERAHLEHHTIAGFILLAYYSQNLHYPAARIAMNHHEKNTGTGYPRGIRLNDPMVEIVAICDIYDALTSPRPYRPVSFDNRSALEEITRMAERNEISWEVVQSLIAHNRRDKPHFTECIISLDKRGVNPPNNLYGVFTP